MKKAGNSDIQPAYLPEEAAAILRVSKNTLLAMLRNGQLKGFRVNSASGRPGPWRIPAESLRDYMDGNTTGKA